MVVWTVDLHSLGLFLDKSGYVLRTRVIVLPLKASRNKVGLELLARLVRVADFFKRFGGIGTGNFDEDFFSTGMVF